MTDEQIFMDRLSVAMDFCGMNASRVCERTGINKSTMSRYVNGERIPSRKKLMLIAQCLGVSEMWLLGLEEREQRQSRLTPEIITKFNSLSLKDQDLIIEIIKKFSL